MSSNKSNDFDQEILREAMQPITNGEIKIFISKLEKELEQQRPFINDEEITKRKQVIEELKT